MFFSVVQKTGGDGASKVCQFNATSRKIPVAKKVHVSEQSIASFPCERQKPPGEVSKNDSRRILSSVSLNDERHALCALSLSSTTNRYFTLAGRDSNPSSPKQRMGAAQNHGFCLVTLASGRPWATSNGRHCLSFFSAGEDFTLEMLPMDLFERDIPRLELQPGRRWGRRPWRRGFLPARSQEGARPKLPGRADRRCFS